jgi:hypothetical protein
MKYLLILLMMISVCSYGQCDTLKIDTVRHDHPWGQHPPCNGCFLPVAHYAIPKDTTDSTPVRRLKCGSAPPSTGKHLLGEYVLNIGADTTIIGFMCTKEGEPGEWQAVRSVIWESEPALVPWIKPGTQQGVINSKSIKLVKPHKRRFHLFKRLRKNK